MTKDNHYDVIVVGLGIMGTSALYQLSKRGVRALGIDRFSPPHTNASSHGDTRITREAVGEGEAYVPFVQRSNQIWRELEAISGEKLFLKSGGLIICPKEGGAQFHAHHDFVGRTAEIAQKFNIPHEVLNAESIMSRYPVLNLKDNEYGYYEPGSGVLRPEKCIQVQLDLARKQNAHIHTEEVVLSYEATADGVIVKTDRGEYHADKIILTTGAWMVDFLPDYRPQMKVYRQVIYWFAAKDITLFTEDAFPYLLWISNTLDDFFAAFPTPFDGIQGVKVMTETYLKDIHPDQINRSVSEQETSDMYNNFVSKHLTHVTDQLLHTGICMYTVTPDQNFMIDFHPTSNRVIIASPCSGHGFKHAAAIGESLSQLALDGHSKLDIQPFALSRFSS